MSESAREDRGALNGTGVDYPLEVSYGLGAIGDAEHPLGEPLLGPKLVKFLEGAEEVKTADSTEVRLKFTTVKGVHSVCLITVAIGTFSTAIPNSDVLVQIK